MKRATILACILSALPTLGFAGQPVLSVNGRTISSFELESAKRVIKAQARGQQIPAETLTRLAVNQVVGHALLAGAAAEAGISVDPAAVEAAIESQREAAGGADAFAARLQQAGLTVAEFRQIETGRLAVQRFVDSAVLPGIEVSEAEMKAYYDGHPDEFKHNSQIRIRQVLVNLGSGAGDEQRHAAQAKAEAALARLRAGESFESVAAEVSDDPSKDRGGEVGWIHEGMLLPGLDAVVFGLGDGELSPVVESPNGFHIFRVDQRRGPGTYGFEETKPILRRMLRQRGVGAALAKLVAQRLTSATIEALDPSLEPFLRSPDAAASPTP